MQLPIGFLVLPPPGDRSVLTLRRKLSLTLLHALLSARPSDAGAAAAPLRRLQAFLEGVLRGAERRKLITALENVDVFVPLLAAKSGLQPLSAALESAIPAMLLAFARSVAGAVQEGLVWDYTVSNLFDAGAGRVLRCRPPAQGLSVSASGVELRTASGEICDLLSDRPSVDSVRCERYLHALSGPLGPALALADSNPLFALEEHPDKGGNALDLGGKPVAAWLSGLRDAFSLLKEMLPGLAQELESGLERIVPVGYQPERHLSASYREAPGLVYLTLHPSTLTMAEAIVHEFQHGKLNLLRFFDPLLSNGDSVWTESAVRPDLRPLNGVLLAVHAFVPVAALHYQMHVSAHPLSATDAFRSRRIQVLAANARGLATLQEKGEPSELGARVLSGLAELHTFLERQCADALPQSSVDALG